MSAPLFESDPTADTTAEPAPIQPPPPEAVDASNAPRSLYRKYRPQTFGDDDLVGQEPIVRTLRNAIRLDRVAHAYLFCGPRGTGKTTTARLLAKAVNCLDPDPDRRPCNRCSSCRAIASGAATDVVEIDAASNRGIDDIRDLRERVKYAPTQLRVKFYIVDEAHQITGPAANAFLKTLEEPPGHTKFVLATTDPEELLPTIVSRCQRFDFRRIGTEATVARLRTVATAESLPATDDALATIARHATGSLRDALGLLDQLAIYREETIDGAADEITADAVRSLLGVSRNDRVETLATALADRDATAALGAVNAAVDAGEDPRQLNRQLVAYLRLLLHQRAGGSPDADERAQQLATRFELAELADLARRFSEVDYRIKHSAYGQLPLEVALVGAVVRDDGRSSQIQTPASAPPRDASPSPTNRSPAATPPPPTPTAAPIDSPSPPDRSSAPTTALRDRVRGVQRPTPAAPAPAQSSSPPSPPAEPLKERAEPTAPGANAEATSPTTNPAGIDLERVVDLWPRIRQDVKAVNRRIEALLSSIDPAAVIGDQVTLAAAYEFHRDKLNTDEVRTVVEDAIGRLAGHPVHVRCVLRDELASLSPTPSTIDRAPAVPPSTPPPASTPPPPATSVAPDNSPSPDDAISNDANGSSPRGADDLGASVVDSGNDSERRLQAAKNIFDAEEIDLPLPKTNTAGTLGGG